MSFPVLEGSEVYEMYLTLLREYIIEALHPTVLAIAVRHSQV